MYFLLAIFSVFIAACAQMLLKKGAKMQYASFWRQYLNVWVIGGYGIMFISMVLNIYAMSQGLMLKELSIIEALSYIFVPTLSFLFFKEKLSWLKVLAIGIIVVGIIIFFT